MRLNRYLTAVYARFAAILFLFVTAIACQKQPDDVSPIEDHPAFIGEWVNMNPEVRENERRFASMLSIDEDGDCSFEGGLQNTYGSFGYKNNSIYISGRALKVLQEPRKLYWVAHVAEPELDYATHCMKIRESKRVGSDPDMIHELVKKDLRQTDGTDFFKDLDTLYTGDDGNHRVVLVNSASDTSMVFELSIEGSTLNDTLRFDPASSARYFEDDAVLQVVDGWMTIRLEKAEGGLRFGYRNADDHYTIFDQQPGEIEELLLLP